MKKLYPLKFKPVVKSKIWGEDALFGRFESALSGLEDIQSPIGEMWQILDLYGQSSVVTDGFLAENTLSDIVETYLGDLVGDNIFEFFQLQFPVLTKILGVRENLSLQVHPNDEVAFERYDSYGKEEFWYVMDAEPGAKIYMGFKKNVSVAEFYDACCTGTLPALMNVYTPEKGDCFIIKPGTVHAAGGGVLLTEVLQPSDITMRLYDWERDLLPGLNRELNVEEAIDCIDYSKFNEEQCYIPAEKAKGVLVDSRNFTVSRVDLAGSVEKNMDEFNGFVIYTAVQGRSVLEADGLYYGIDAGEAVLVPAQLDCFSINPKAKDTVLLQISVKEQKEPDDSYIEK